jgi:hypothetical protein
MREAKASVRAPIRAPVEDQTRARVPAIAAEGFAREGCAAASVRDKARGAGVTVGAIRVHVFPSQGWVLGAVYEEGARRVGRAVDAAIAGAAGPWERSGAAAIARQFLATGARTPGKGHGLG